MTIIDHLPSAIPETPWSGYRSGTLLVTDSIRVPFAQPRAIQYLTTEPNFKVNQSSHHNLIDTSSLQTYLSPSHEPSQ